MESFFDRLSQCLTADPAFSTFNPYGKVGLFFLYPTKNKEGKRDPEMRQTRKGNIWHFGMKMHIGTDDAVGLIRSIETTPANLHDIVVADQLLHGEEQRAWGDAGYLGVDKREEHADSDVDWRVGCRPGKRKKMLAESDEAKTEKVKLRYEPKSNPLFYTSKRFLVMEKYVIVVFPKIEIGSVCWPDFITWSGMTNYWPEANVPGIWQNCQAAEENKGKSLIFLVFSLFIAIENYSKLSFLNVYIYSELYPTAVPADNFLPLFLMKKQGQHN
jgi:DDE family transposase